MLRFIRNHSASIAILILVAVSVGGIFYAYVKAESERRGREMLRSSGSAPVALLNETDFDWGEIDRSAIAKQDFIIRNSGKSDLTIEEIVTSCSCTTAELLLEGRNATLPAVLLPNGNGIIHVEFDPDAHDSRGSTNRAVRIETNDPDRPFLVINLHAYVR